MQFTSPIPFSDAIDKLSDRRIVTSSATSSEWSLVATGLRERAFFSARVESARVLQSMRDYLGDYLAVSRQPDGSIKAHSRAEFVANMRELAIREGLGTIDPVTGQISPDIRESDLTDIRSIRRLELIFDTQVESAQEFGYWKQGQDPDILAVFPAQRFIRVRPVLAPRGYHEAALGEIRRKDDLAFWISLNRDFGVPWGPWGFGSGCGVEDADRDEAVAAGVMKESDQVKPVAKDFNDGLSAGIRDLDTDIAAALARATGGRAAAGRLTPRAATATRPPAAVPADLATILADLGLDSPDATMTVATARRLIDELREDSPEKGMSKVAKLSGAQRKGSGTLTRQFVSDTVNDMVALLPKALVKSLPDIRIQIVPALNAAGNYNESARVLKLNKRALQDPGSARKTIFHELFHWAHDHGPQSFRDQVKAFYNRRTAGEAETMLRPWNQRKITGRRDKWMDADGDEYAARIYPWERNDPAGLEVVTRHLEKLSDPAALARNWNHKLSDGSRPWREAFLEVSSILFPHP